MKERGLILIFLLAASLVAQAGPDDEFAQVVKVIQHGDQMVEQGKDRAAMDEYRKAQDALLKFRKVYPDWDKQVVAFRLRYLGDRLGNWTDTPEVAEPKSDTEVDALRNRINFLERSSQQYQAQVNQLVGENNRLSSRLREALAIRPAAADPKLLADAQEKLSSAESEITQLKAKIKELETDLAELPKPDEAKKNAKLVEELRKNLNLTLADTDALRKENAELRKAAAKATVPQAPKDDATNRQIEAQVAQSAAELAIQQLKSENSHLQQELVAAQKKADEQPPAPTAATKGFRAADRARMALANNRGDEAIQALAPELETHPDNIEGWYLMGLARLEKNDYEDAEAALKKALVLKPDWGAAHAGLARLYLRRSPADPALARWHYHKAVEAGFPRDKSLEQSMHWEQPDAPR
ncbi:tetratricopeptide repeat protein [bacterium]|nr:tetratricopeptide repeat protein [bacterium]